MLVKIYQKTRSGWEFATQYYDWSTQFRPKDDDDYIGGRVTCPGCGKETYKQHMRFEHMCPGTLTDRPVEVNRVNWSRVERKLQESRVNQYVQNAQHRIVTSG